MINKKSLWFLTLFSLILVLSVYYVTMPTELLLTGSNQYNTDSQEKKKETKKNENEATVSIEESEILTSLRVEADEQMVQEMNELKEILTNSESTTEEKNQAFEKMKNLNVTRGEEETLEKNIKSEFNLEAFVKIDGDQIRVVVVADMLDNKQANNIMRSIQKNYDTKKYISVKYQK